MNIMLLARPLPVKSLGLTEPSFQHSRMQALIPDELRRRAIAYEAHFF
jgi:hypothetical protein